jgi:transcriptional regulator with XRE-family HTH domain
MTNPLAQRAKFVQYTVASAKEHLREAMARKNKLSNVSNGKKKSNGVRKSQRAAGKPDVELGKRIRLRRVEQKISQDELGKALGVSFQQVQKYEKGVNRVGAARLQQISTALDVPVTFFYDGDGKTREVESLLFLDSSFSLRLLRAYSKIKDQTVQRCFVSLMEGIAANE